MAEIDEQDVFQDKIIDFIPALRGYARSLYRNNTDADDLVQETLLRAILHVDTFQRGTNLRAWLFTIMRNRFYTAIAKAKREPTGAAENVSELLTTPASQEPHMELMEVGRAMGNLPNYCRDTLAFVILSGQSYNAAARHFACDIGTIKSRISRGRRLIRDALRDR